VCSSDGSKLGSCVCSGGSGGTGGAGGFSGSGGRAGAGGSIGGNGEGGQAGGAGATGGGGPGGVSGSGGVAGATGGAGSGGQGGRGGAAGQATGGGGAGTGGGAGVVGVGGTAGTGAQGGAGGTATVFSCSGTILGIADFDGDGTPDCVTTTPAPAGIGPPPDPPRVLPVFLKGLGAGYSQTGVVSSAALTSTTFGISTADLSGDGRADLIVQDSRAGSLPSIDFIYLKTQPDSTFTRMSTMTFSGVGYPVGALRAGTGDFNGDSKPDLLFAAWANDHNAQSVDWLLISDKGSTDLSANLGLGTFGSLTLANVPGDFNSDGKLDVALVPHFENLGHTTNTRNVAIAYGAGDGTFARPVNVPAASGATDVLVGDLNGDGKLDLNVSLATLTALYGDGAGNFSTTPP